MGSHLGDDGTEAAEPSETDDPVTRSVGEPASVAPGPAADATPPSLPDRYRAVRHLGAGGMGTVLEAHDTALDRPVALKRVRADRGDREWFAARFRREARALAALHHPNVVEVFDLFDWDGALFIAMERVDGMTLRDWQRAPGRTPAEIVDAYVQAGRALAAAHAAGIVHRDFKPTNALVDAEGRVRVLDFGLAVQASEGPGSEVSRAGSVALSEDSLRLTTVGTVLGTPAYMAPEHAAGSAAAASDQFSFCVSLWEGLFGHRPYRGRATAEKLDAIPRVPPRDCPVPTHVWSAIRRGLADMPKQRWPSMDALVAALDPGRAHARRRWWIGGAAVTTAVLAAIAIARPRDHLGCRHELGTFDAIWTEASRVATRDALFATLGEDAPVQWPRIDESVARFGTHWDETADVACRPGTARQTIACLDEGRARAAELLDLVAEGDAKLARHAAQQLADLPEPSGCLDPATAGHAVSTSTSSPTTAAHARALAAALARLDAGDTLVAFERLRALLPEVEAGGDPLLLVRTLFSLGSAEQRLARFTDASQHLERAYWLAAEGDALGALPEVAAQLALSVASADPERTDEALDWLRHAETQVDRFKLLEIERARLYRMRGLLLRKVGRYDEAKAALERALEIQREHAPHLSPDMADVRINLGNLHDARGDVEAAHAEYEAARETLETHYGPDHPGVRPAIDGLALIALRTGRWQEAERWLRRSIEIETEHEGAPDWAALTNLAIVVQSQGRNEEAIDLNRRALSAATEHLDENDPTLASIELNLALALAAAGNVVLATRECERATRALEAILGPDDPTVATAQAALAELYLRADDTERALALTRRATETTARSMPCTHPNRSAILAIAAQAELTAGELDRAAAGYADALRCAASLEGGAESTLARVHNGLADLALRRGDLERARTEVDHATPLAVASPGEPLVQARTDALRARLLAADGDRAAARTLATEVRARLRQQGDLPGVASLDAWLAALD